MARILLIEANAAHAKLIKDRLKKEMPKSNVDIVPSLDRGLVNLRKRTYHCIVTDSSPPDVSGSTLVRTLRKASDNVPIIVVTGRGDTRSGAEMIRNGATDYVGKSRTSLEMIPELVKKNIVKNHVQRSALMIPAHIVAKMGGLFDEIERNVSRDVLKKIRKIRKSAERLLKF